MLYYQGEYAIRREAGTDTASQVLAKLLRYNAPQHIFLSVYILPICVITHSLASLARQVHLYSL